MAMTAHYRLGPVQVGASPTTLGGITDVGIPAGLEVMREPVSGEIGVRTQSITAIKPTGSFTTPRHQSGAVGVRVAGHLAVYQSAVAVRNEDRSARRYCHKRAMSNGRFVADCSTRSACRPRIAATRRSATTP